MNKTPQIKIGNEHFKTWLKKLDPQARVEKMSAIAKTQASTGLRGSLIKASLAQLSQRCVVMLIRLTDQEIKHFTRRKPIKRLETPSNIQLHSSLNKTKLTNLDKCNNIDKCTNPENNMEKLLPHDSYELMNEIKNMSKSHIEIDQGFKKKEVTIPKRISLKLSSDSDRKFNRKFKELFGDDYDDRTVAKNSFFKENNSHGNESDKQVNNYVSTTVNVNIYNSPNFEETTSNPTVIKRTHQADSCVLNSNESGNKKLRIDVSLSNEKSNTLPFRNYSMNDETRLEKNHKDKKKKKSTHNSPKSKDKNKTSTSKTNKSTPTSLNISVCSEDDPSIKELWSIFGMESPKDRSEIINKSHPLHDETITLNRASKLNKPELVTDNGCQKIVTSEEAPQECLSSSMVSSEKYQSEKNTSVDDICIIDEPTLSENIISEEVGTVCKIAETFSLANISSNVPNLFPKGTTINLTEMSTDNEKTNVDKWNVIKINTKATERISVQRISDNGEKEESNQYNIASTMSNSNNKEKKICEERNKIGTIRVKNLGLLLNPIPSIDTINLTTTEGNSCNINQIVTDNQQLINSQQSQDNISQRTDDPQRVEECFFNIYKHYFDDLLESKIPKLGELLHLAVADGIRRNERIKRAEQLSSDDLIKEEKQRAEKDFNEMMRIRGQEFSPLCEFILGRFDQSSKITLFNALFCRIMKHAEQIDPANRNYTVEARNVIQKMLSKHQFKDKEISDFLQSGSQFRELMAAVSNLVEKFTNHDNQRENVQIDKNIVSKINLNVNSSIDSISCNLSNIKPVQNIVHSSNTNAKTHNVQIAPKALLPKNSLQVSGTQNSIPQRKSMTPLVNIATPTSTVVNNSSNQSSPSKTSPFQLSCATPIAFVSVPQSSTMSLGGVPKISNQLGSYRPVQIQKLSQPSLTTVAPATFVNSSNMVNPSIFNLGLFAQSSMSTSAPQRPILITSVPSQSNLYSTPRSFGLTTGQTIPKEPTHVIVNRLGTNVTNNNLPKQNHHPIVLREIGTYPKSSSSLNVTSQTATISRTPTSASSTTKIPVATSATMTHSNPVTQSASTPPSELSNILSTSTQCPMPSSSHCHPFIKRMPISGKMKMFFGNTNSRN